MQKFNLEELRFGQTCVVIREFPFDVENNEILPELRLKEIDECLSAKTKESKFYAWKLLEKLLPRVADCSIADTYFDEDICKWKISNFCFSISHSNNIVAIAVSRLPIGVDIELIDESRFATLRREKILSKGESVDTITPRQLGVIWSQKEAVFKSLDQKYFLPNKVVVDGNVKSEILRIGDREFVLSIASEDTNIHICNQCN